VAITDPAGYLIFVSEVGSNKVLSDAVGIRLHKRLSAKELSWRDVNQPKIKVNFV
jgi:hypothetical protein